MYFGKLLCVVKISWEELPTMLLCAEADTYLIVVAIGNAVYTAVFKAVGPYLHVYCILQWISHTCPCG